MKYGTCNQWAEHLKETEDVSISYNAIANRLKQVGKTGVSGKSTNGRMLKEAFYSESDIREVCAELLQKLACADKNGFFEIDGVRYATISAWAKKLAVASRTIRLRIMNCSAPLKRGKNQNGRVYDFYSEPDVRETCSDLLLIPQADENGFFIENGIRYGLLSVWAEYLKKEEGVYVDPRTLRSRLKSVNKVGRDGRNRIGHVKSFYSEPDIREIFSDFLSTPQAGENGFIQKDGEKYAMVSTWAREYGVSPGGIQHKLRQVDKKLFIKGADSLGRVYNFYPESFILKICKELFQQYPQADQDGFIDIGSERYGYSKAWARFLDIPESTIRLRLSNTKISAIKLGDSGGFVRDFYPEPAVRKACADLLVKKSKK